MDKIKNITLKKYSLALLLVATVLLKGCSTTGGAISGFSRGTGEAIVSTAEGAQKDAFSLARFIQNVDQWIKDNLW